MINDETNWHILNQGFCSFKVKLKQPPDTFCRNEYNVTGLCNRVSCPLANSEYATVIEKEGLCYLYIKTVERAHTPKKMWEKIELSKNFMQALAQIDEQLLHWADHKKNRCKQRLTKLRQVLLRQRKAALEPKMTTMVGIKQKTEKREAVREEKAEKAAKVEMSIEKELLERLKLGTYGDLYQTKKQKEKSSASNKAGEKELNSEEEQSNEMELEYEDSEGERLMELEDGDEEVDERDLAYIADLNDSDDDGIPDEDLSDLSSDEEDEQAAGETRNKNSDDDMSDDDEASSNSPDAKVQRREDASVGSSSRRSTDVGDIEDLMGSGGRGGSSSSAAERLRKKNLKKKKKKNDVAGGREKEQQQPEIEYEMEDEENVSQVVRQKALVRRR
ncbi:unnamed protein product [Amoebophrya sp. A120]|nr:unnamed protein product [Amoebophrya sp. A120]|eukprot:GSA120T00008952001.1